MHQFISTSSLLLLVPALLANARPQDAASVAPTATQTIVLNPGETFVPITPPPGTGVSVNRAPGNVQCYGTNVEPNLLNTPACTYLLNTRMPSLLNLNDRGRFDQKQRYHWDLGTDSPGFVADDCHLDLAPLIEGSWLAFVVPQEFVDLARNNILPACGGAEGHGGQQRLGTYDFLEIRLSTQTKGVNASASDDVTAP